MSTKINNKYDSVLALNICNGIRPEINEQEAPKFYINLMTNCWDSDPDKRPNEEIKKQIKKAEEYRRTNFLFAGNSQSIHPQACYTSRLLNQFIKELPKHDNTCNISAEVIDFTDM
ncbi:kinase-like domain-containing protein [Rhizophagus irregularis DAOM 181602=DAOM 197198]|uniref:Uncharacterized protein n=1 Tax=Rhizophagus irregularis (strain DAOM 181602 / DAOM 197198 / MUCL 43194) TaxID=747089 RepID=U9SJP1_RHIID|nr:kinase-like domain-containing protein [Rhizophagus irregularis DAOM 181602=DAOM 197198]